MKFIDLFAGIGGFRLALEKYDQECVFSSDIDKFARQTYEHNFGEKPHGDITEIETDDIPDFDILTAGFPCQPFSYAGKNEGFKDKTRGTLFFDILRVLESHKPKMFLLENVKGLKSHRKGKTLKIIEESLEELGYTIHWKVLNSHNFGIPQKRERWFCVGFDKPLAFKFPKGDKPGTVLRDIVDFDVDNESLRISDLDLKRIEDHFKSDEERVEHDNSMYDPDTKKGKHGVYTYQKPDGSIRFHVGDKSKTQIQESFYACLDTYAPTLIANRVPQLWDLERKLSVNECKKLQGFPESFEFPVSNHQAYKQLGNAVPVPVVEAVFENMLKFYELEKPKSEELVLDL